MRTVVLMVAILWTRGVLAAPVPDDPRLATTRAQLQTIVDAAAEAQLPPTLLVDKIREGLAKGVAPERIVVAVRSLGAALATARAEAVPHFATPPAAMLKAIVDAHALGAKPAEVDSLLKVSVPRGAAPATRAIEVLADLAQRQYPPALAARAISEIVARRPAALAELPARADALAQASGVTRAEVLDALGRAAAQGLGLENAGQLLHARDGSPQGDGRGPNRDSEGQRGPGAGHGKGHP
jgi:hypothetical protein